MNETDTIRTVMLDDEKSALVILDQTLLPGEEKILYLTSQEEIREAIYLLKVRGAPAIGVAAAIGIYLAAKGIAARSYTDFYPQFAAARAYLASARPTAVNLFWALGRMEKVVTANRERPVKEIVRLLKAEAEEILQEDVRVCRAIGENGLKLLEEGGLTQGEPFGILTHCNAGRLATAEYGTALSPLYVGQEKGYTFRVFADETRPLLQGARLTAYELNAAGIDTTVICDNMASQVMKNGWVRAIFVGCDRLAANGDACNKIGTSGLAILAKYYRIPFYVCAPSSTIDWNTARGCDIPIEQRPAAEVTEMWFKRRIAPEGVHVYNPAFDVAEHKNITAIITEHGVAKPPFSEALRALCGRE